MILEITFIIESVSTNVTYIRPIFFMNSAYMGFYVAFRNESKICMFIKIMKLLKKILYLKIITSLRICRMDKYISTLWANEFFRVYLTQTQ